MESYKVKKIEYYCIIKYRIVKTITEATQNGRKLLSSCFKVHWWM